VFCKSFKEGSEAAFCVEPGVSAELTKTKCNNILVASN
jgi:hypothetical protein